MQNFWGYRNSSLTNDSCNCSAIENTNKGRALQSVLLACMFLRLSRSSLLVLTLMSNKLQQAGKHVHVIAQTCKSLLASSDHPKHELIKHSSNSAKKLMRNLIPNVERGLHSFASSAYQTSISIFLKQIATGR